MFTGGGLADIGMMDAGWKPIWGIEVEPSIAKYYCLNIHSNIIVKDVREVDYSELLRPDHLHASPVCKNASVAKSGACETEWDIECVAAVSRAIRELEPHTFSLENVYGYRKFKSYQNICQTLTELGYWFDEHHMDASHYGVPQSRKRLILRATKDDHLKPMVPDTRIVGWYEAIEDLIPTLPESRFAKWQLERMPAEMQTMLMRPNGEDMDKTWISIAHY